MFNRQDYLDFRDLPPSQGTELFNKMYVQVLFDVTSFICWRVSKQPKYSSRLAGSRPLYEINTNINLQLEVTLKSSSSERNIPQPTRECWSETSGVQITTQVCLWWKPLLFGVWQTARELHSDSNWKYVWAGVPNVQISSAREQR